MRLLVPALLLCFGHAWAEPVVLVTDPAALAEVERAGLDLGGLVAGAPGAANDVLSRTAAWRAVTQSVRADVAALGRSDPESGVGIAGHAHRLFDVRWLAARSSRFELVGVANRMDRAAAHPEGCGETRLVYRLRYRIAGVGSRLPMTVLVTLGASGDCRALARRWEAGDRRGAALGTWLVSPDGPLASREVTQVAVNYQLVRWPSAVRPDLGGHAEYVLRAFVPAGGTLRPRRLENTPRLDRKARPAIVAWMTANARAIDEGTALLPEALAAEKSVSVSPHGMARMANRPFRQLVGPDELGAIDFSLLSTVRSPEAFLLRLDEMTCAGCHQTRAVAGFHLLGEDGPEEAAGNALAVAASPHTTGDLARRRAWVTAIAEGRPGDTRQPFATPTGDVQSPSPDLGESCEPLLFSTSADARRDRARLGERRPCAGGRVCEATSVGFPGGMCAGSCDTPAANGTCGAIAILSDFNACLARKTPFPDCLARHTRPALLRACSASAPCRDDYLCARTPSGQGACIPPYFLFQMRVDGHAPP